MDIYKTLVFHFVLFVAGFLACVSRASYNGKFRSWRRTLTVSLLTGFVAVAVVGYVAEEMDHPEFVLGKYVAMSVALGVMGEWSLGFLERFYKSRIGGINGQRENDN